MTNKQERYLITHTKHGVYLGNCLGLGFWSKLDPVGQPAAVTFSTVREAQNHAESWENRLPIAVFPIEVAAADGYATIAECIAAGQDAWSPDDEPKGGEVG